MQPGIQAVFLRFVSVCPISLFWLLPGELNTLFIYLHLPSRDPPTGSTNIVTSNGWSALLTVGTGWIRETITDCGQQYDSEQSETCVSPNLYVRLWTFVPRTPLLFYWSSSLNWFCIFGRWTILYIWEVDWARMWIDAQAQVIGLRSYAGFDTVDSLRNDIVGARSAFSVKEMGRCPINGSSIREVCRGNELLFKPIHNIEHIRSLHYVYLRDFTAWSLRFAIVQNPLVWTPLTHGRFWGITATYPRQAYRSRMDHSLTMIDFCTISLEILLISRHCVAQQIFARLIISSCLVIGSAYSCWLSLHGSYWSMIWLTCNCVRNDGATDC